MINAPSNTMETVSIGLRHETAVRLRHEAQLLGISAELLAQQIVESEIETHHSSNKLKFAKMEMEPLLEDLPPVISFSETRKIHFTLIESGRLQPIPVPDLDDEIE